MREIYLLDLFGNSSKYLFRTWAARRKHTKLRKQRQTYPQSVLSLIEDKKQVAGKSQSPVEDDDAKVSQHAELGRPTLPKGTKLITFPIGHSIPVTNNDPTSQSEGQGTAGGVNGQAKHNILKALNC